MVVLATAPLQAAGVLGKKKLRVLELPQGPKSQPGTAPVVGAFAPVSRLMYTPAKVLGTAMGVLNVTTTAWASVVTAAVPARAAAHMPSRSATLDGSRVEADFVCMLVLSLEVDKRETCRFQHKPSLPVGRFF